MDGLNILPQCRLQKGYKSLASPFPCALGNAPWYFQAMANQAQSFPRLLLRHSPCFQDSLGESTFPTVSSAPALKELLPTRVTPPCTERTLSEVWAHFHAVTWPSSSDWAFSVLGRKDRCAQQSAWCTGSARQVTGPLHLPGSALIRPALGNLRRPGPTPFPSPPH